MVVVVVVRGGGSGGGREGGGFLFLFIGLEVVPEKVLEFGHDAVDVCVAIFDSVGVSG